MQGRGAGDARWYGRHEWHGLLSPRCSLPTEKAGAKAPAFFAGAVSCAIPTSDCCGHARGKGFTSAPQPGTTHHPLLHIIALDGKSCCNAAKQEAKGCGSRLSMKARSEERRVGKECVSTCRSRWSPYN